MQKVDVYTDGGCLGNPGPGGWAAIIYEAPKPVEISGFEKGTTNQRMELKAAIESLRHVGGSSHLRLHSDSAYVINGMKQKWYLNWQKNGWLTAKKKPVENQDLWKALIELSNRSTVEWHKVKGHSGVPANERCDALVQLEIAKGTGQADRTPVDTEVFPEDEGDNEPAPTTDGSTKAVDKRLMGETAEKVFLSLVNQKGVFATSFDTEGLDGIAFDPDHRLFKVGQSPYFVQIKSRNSGSERYESKNFPQDGIRNIETFAQGLGIARDSLYFVLGFSKGNDIRTIRYFAVPFSSLDRFKTSSWYVFSIRRCEEVMEEDSGIFSL